MNDKTDGTVATRDQQHLVTNLRLLDADAIGAAFSCQKCSRLDCRCLKNRQGHHGAKAERRAHRRARSEAEHRTKNILATVQATVNLSHADTIDGLKRAIEGRIQPLAKLHDLFVKSRWAGAELSRIAAHELAPYVEEGETRVRIDGPQVLLSPNTAQAIGVTHVQSPPADPPVSDVVPADRNLMGYDQQHLVTYLRLLGRRGAD